MADAPTPAGAKGRGMEVARQLLHGRGSVIGLVVVFIVAVFVSPGFLSGGNIWNLLSQNAPIGIVALAMTFLILTRDFDLSVGGVYAIASVEVASIAQSHGLGVAIPVVLAIGALCGLINGFIVVVIGVNSFVATLGTGSIFTGIAYEISHNHSVFVDAASFSTLGAGRVAGIPYCVLLLAALTLVGFVLLRSTVLGRHVYAIGGNPQAAFLTGTRVMAIRIGAFVAVGLFAALGGIVFTSQVGVGQANIGSTLPLQSIAIVVVGGTSLAGGEGGVLRTVVGLLILGILNNVTDALALNSSVQMIVQGAVVVVAVAADAANLRRLNVVGTLRSRARMARLDGLPPAVVSGGAFAGSGPGSDAPVASTSAERSTAGGAVEGMEGALAGEGGSVHRGRDHLGVEQHDTGAQGPGQQGQAQQGPVQQASVQQGPRQQASVRQASVQQGPTEPGRSVAPATKATEGDPRAVRRDARGGPTSFVSASRG